MTWNDPLARTQPCPLTHRPSILICAPPRSLSGVAIPLVPIVSPPSWHVSGSWRRPSRGWGLAAGWGTGRGDNWRRPSRGGHLQQQGDLQRDGGRARNDRCGCYVAVNEQLRRKLVASSELGSSTKHTLLVLVS